MGRIFTVDFMFEGRQYTAFVKITTVADFFSVHIHLPDPTLHHLVPGGNIVYKSTEGVALLRQDTSAPAFELISRVVEAVEQYLKQG